MKPEHVSRRQLLLGLLGLTGCGALGLPRIALAMDAMPAASGHEHHHHGETPQGVQRSEASVQLPVLRLVRQDGREAAFPDELDDGRPVLLNFIYTSCTAICPLTSQVFSRVQSALAADGATVDLVSISIDPEYDTPRRLADYAKTFAASQSWHFYTGTQAASVAMQRAFNVYRGDKMNHIPVTFLRAAPGKPWTRLEGFASADELVREYRSLIGSLSRGS